MSLNGLVSRIKSSVRHKHLYHFTDELNFPSINAMGLVSKARMRKEGWWPDASGGNPLSWELDRRFGVDPFVSLCMTTNHPMKYVAQQRGGLPNPRYLQISPEVLLIPGVRICFGVANTAGANLLPIAEALDTLDADILYNRTDWNDPHIQARLRAAEKFEVLVPESCQGI